MQPTRKGQKSNLTLAVKLSSIDNRVKKAVIREYFNMFKMLYRIRSIVAYCWDNGESSSKTIKKLYNKDKTFVKMIKIVQRSIWNLFQGTDKNWTALGAENHQTQPVFN